MGFYSSTGIKTILTDLRGWITQKLGLKADSVHTHAKSDVTGLTSDLSTLSEDIGNVSTLNNTRWAHLAPLFDDEATYHKGDIVRYNEQGDPSDSFYQFNTTHTGAWNSAHVDWIKLADVIKEAASKGVTDTVASGSTDLVESGAVYTAINTAIGNAVDNLLDTNF